jgi:lysophospholipase L1-like esterase
VVAALLAVLLALAGLLSVLGGGTAAPDRPRPTSAGTSSTAPGPTASGSAVDVTDYVVLGDSLAAGYSPSNPGDRTDPDGGYAGVVRDGLAVGGHAPRLRNLACPGETTVSMRDGGLCDYPEGSQLAAAEAALAEEGDGAGVLVTVQLGANDVLRCVSLAGGAPAVDEACVSAGLRQVATTLPTVLARVRDAAPGARIVLLDYYDPYAAAALLGSDGAELARRTEEVQARLNAAIDAAADGAGAEIAHVGAAFAAAGQVCSLTWMCSGAPDIHATPAGYELMGATVLEALGQQ